MLRKEKNARLSVVHPGNRHRIARALASVKALFSPPMDLQNESVRIILSRPDNRERNILRETQTARHAWSIRAFSFPKKVSSSPPKNRVPLFSGDFQRYPAVNSFVGRATCLPKDQPFSYAARGRRQS